MKRLGNLLNKIFIGYLLLLNPIFAENSLKIGYVYFDPPYILSPEQGFEVELVKMLCNTIQKKCDLIPMNFHKLFNALLTNKIDFAFDSMNIVKNLPMENYIYSEPYIVGYGQFLIRADYNKLQNNQIPKTAVFGLVKEREQITEGVYYRVLLEKYGNNVSIKIYDTTDDLVQALLSKKIDAAFLDKYSSKYWIMNSNKQFVKVGTDIKIGDGIGLISLKKNQALMDEFNKALLLVEQTEEFKKLYDNYL
jgi:ABC-type amino acid transport substrate-binding protein